MVNQAESADERALRRELQALAKKRETINSTKRRGSGEASRKAIGRGSVFARLGGEPTRTGRQVVHLKVNNTRGNASWRLGKRENEDVRQRSHAMKKQKLHSAVARPDGVDHPDGGVETSRNAVAVTSPSANNARAQERKQRAVAPYAQKDGIARSRRMFGALMGHLGKAKRQIEKDTDLFKRQDTKQHEAEQREKAQSKNLEDQARLEAKTAQLEALIVRTELDRREQIVRAKLEHLQTVRKSESQSKFLVTIASPPIYYLPSRHTKETRELVAASMEAHEAKVKAKERSHEEKLRKLEAEFETKLEQLRADLKALKKSKEEDSADEQATSDKENDIMDDKDRDIDRFNREDEKHRQESPNEQCDGPLAMEAEKKDTVQESVSGSERDDSSRTESRITGGEDGKALVQPESQSIDGNEPSTSPQKSVDGMDGDHSDMEASSSSRVNEKLELGKEDVMPNNQPAMTCVEREREEEELASRSDTATAVDRHEIGDSIESKEDAAVDVDKMKVIELRAELKERGLDAKGLKAKLVQRLKQAMHDEDESK
ncbi:unnamed protein product [Peronospora belbahrii]|uniref:SAP domain-containing protein n=1 Tax=Peronospora belbahrii TaxID=622444 RepID=A0AAU9KJZ7_9STRA|nr:unnamed protein product [Peronospora belbahrii]CAH0520735.1 unnamed protein product [Peronospora belbahrii]